MRRFDLLAGAGFLALLLLLACSRSGGPEPVPTVAQKPKEVPIAQGMVEREESRYSVTIEAADPAYALKRLRALPEGMTRPEQRAALALGRENTLDIYRPRYLDFLRILQELGGLQVERQPFMTRAPATEPIPFVLRITAAKAPAAALKPASNSPDSRSRRVP